MASIDEIPNTREALEARVAELFKSVNDLRAAFFSPAISQALKSSIKDEIKSTYALFLVAREKLRKIKQDENTANDTASDANLPTNDPPGNAPATLTKHHVEPDPSLTTSDDFGPKANAPVDTSNQSDTAIVPPPTSESDTAGDNWDMNGVLAARINRVVETLARLAEVVRKA